MSPKNQQKLLKKLWNLGPQTDHQNVVELSHLSFRFPSDHLGFRLSNEFEGLWPLFHYLQEFLTNFGNKTGQWAADWGCCIFLTPPTANQFIPTRMHMFTARSSSCISSMHIQLYTVIYVLDIIALCIIMHHYASLCTNLQLNLPVPQRNPSCSRVHHAAAVVIVSAISVAPLSPPPELLELSCSGCHHLMIDKYIQYTYICAYIDG